jgi:hypothetical protein
MLSVEYCSYVGSADILMACRHNLGEMMRGTQEALWNSANVLLQMNMAMMGLRINIGYSNEA